MRLRDKVAIVTGSGSGIGRGIALRLAREGASVIVTANEHPERAAAVGVEIRQLGARELALQLDVRDVAAVQRMVVTVLDEFGRIDILVNNAGGGARERGRLFHEASFDTLDHVIGKNLMGTLYCSRAVLPAMVERQDGVILSIASGAAVNGADKDMRGGVEYSAAKAGYLGFTMALSKQIARHGVRVNCISPGPINTTPDQPPNELMKRLQDRNPLGRMGTPDEVAALAANLASDEAKWITGQNFTIDGGESLGL